MTPTLERLHHEHKARLARMRSAAWRPPTPEPEPTKPTSPPPDPIRFGGAAKQIASAMAQIEGSPPIGCVLSRLRKPRFVAWRMALAHALRQELGYSYPRIGKLLGRDHTTVMHAVQKIDAAIAAGTAQPIEVDGFKFYIEGKWL